MDKSGIRKVRKIVRLGLTAMVVLAPIRTDAQTAASQDCAGLAGQKLPNTTISSAQAVTAGSFTVPGSSNTISGLPPFCRVAGVIAPTSDSEIRFEVWLPLENWNRKFSGVGNGGWAGNISYGALAEQLRRGYATASTNTGHEAGTALNLAKFAFEKPERLLDFAYRSHHELALKSKSIVEAFYAKRPERAYFIGCSSGGYEGLMEAQRFPEDYDGIVAGAPANNWTRLMAGDFDASLATFKGGVNNLPTAALGVLHRAAISRCDAKDGVVDGIIEDPSRCAFDPAEVRCKAGEQPDKCLTAEQVEAARRVYGGLKDPGSGARLFPGMVPGSEPFWPNRDPALPFAIPVSHYKWLVFGDPDWDWKTFDFAKPGDFQAHKKAEAKFGPIMNATAPDLTAFRQRGGKLLQYHGWNDQLITPLSSIEYYESVVSFFGAGRDRTRGLEEVHGFYRLFMAPGMAHCSGGTGPNTFDMQGVLERWVEHGAAPDQVVAARAVNGVVDRTRPLCLYPKAAVYKGTGDTNDDTNYECR
jgi:feruloyl esterase